MNPVTSSSPAPARLPAASGSPSRLESVDLLRGLVMVIMALDHTRDFFHEGALQQLDPLDLAHPNVALFLTRWITHFCAPVFVFLAGTGAFLATTRGKSPRALSWFLITRGFWLILLELTWVRWLGWTFTINLHEHWFLVIWAIGWSMVVLGLLVPWLPERGILAFGLLLIVGHNALDSVSPEAWGHWGWLWQVLHAGGRFHPSSMPDLQFGAGYPLVPWIGVMAVGYCFGRLLLWEPQARQRALIYLGSGLILAFLVLRGTNLYGDPKPWTRQAHAGLTLLGVLDCHKYPPSLAYLLMTLGPALLVLAWMDRSRPRWLQPCLVFGRVPLFYYLLHLPLIHALAVALSLVQVGHADWLYGLHPAKPPVGAGVGLLGTYLVWIAVVLTLYPVCRWFAGVKRRRREAWLSYL
jgi:uncharacterized membrane protein